MASRSHLMIDALQYLADPDRYARSATDERAAVVARARSADTESRWNVRRNAAILTAVAATVVASVAALFLGAAA